MLYIQNNTYSRTQRRHIIYTYYYPHIDYANKNFMPTRTRCIIFFEEWQPYTTMRWAGMMADGTMMDAKSVKLGQRSQTREIYSLEWPKT